MKLEFTTTACNRPDVLEMTYRSYTSRLKNIDFSNSTLYINVDPAPNSNNIQYIKTIAEKYFGTVICNFPKEPNFAAAVLWCFNQVKEDMFFHLEDDWILMRDVDINKMVNSLGKNNIQCILNKSSKYMSRKEAGEPALMPSLFSKKYVDKYVALMNDSKNPEAQMKYIFRKNTDKLRKHRSVLFGSRCEYSKDIGRQWLRKNGLRREYEKTSNSNSKRKWSPWVTWVKGR